MKHAGAKAVRAASGSRSVACQGRGMGRWRVRARGIAVRLRRGSAAVTLAMTATLGGCFSEGGESDASVAEPFTVRFETSKGPVDVEFVPEWSPLAVERVRELAQEGFWEGARIYRVNDRYAQFGYSGDPEVDSVWIAAGLPDEPTRARNTRGTVSFARGGPGSRSAILFINRSDNTDLDQLLWNEVVGFPPVGRVVAGMDRVDALNSEYGDEPMQWEDSIAAVGNAFLDRAYPGLDSIVAVEVR